MPNQDETMSRRGMPAPDPGDEVRDDTPSLEPKDFDADAFLRGVRPTVRSVRIFDRADLIGPIEELADEIDRTPGHVDVDDKIDQLEQLREQFLAGTWYSCEGRSDEWVTAFRAESAARLGLDVGDWAEKPDDAQAKARERVLVEQLAEQVVRPGSVTTEALLALAAANGPEFAKLLVCMSYANAQPAGSAQVLTRDFSQRRSKKRPGPRRSATR